MRSYNFDDLVDDVQPYLACKAFGKNHKIVYDQSRWTSREDTVKILEAIFRVIIGALKRGERVEIMGFGLFYPQVSKDKPYPYKLPSGELTTEIRPSKKVIHFRAHKNLCEATGTKQVRYGIEVTGRPNH